MYRTAKPVLNNTQISYHYMLAVVVLRNERLRQKCNPAALMQIYFIKM